MKSLILRATTPILVVMLMIFSIYALLRGHHEPGGGFIGGLLGAAAFSLHALAHDVRTTRRLLKVSPHILMGAGLMMLVVAGLLGLVLGQSFLQGQWIDIYVPGRGVEHIGSPLLFDIGVYAVVMGMVLTAIFEAAEK